MSAPRLGVAGVVAGLLATLAAPMAGAQALPTPVVRNGQDIYAEFRAGLADPTCDTGSSQRWRGLYSTAPTRLATPDSDVLALFGYVVDAVREADLPTEYALIPFVESGYRPGARSASGPAGLWQLITVTARNHQVPIRAGYDGRLSPVDSTRAAVRYLKTLHGMFAGDWRLAVMAYNAGEYRVFDALRRSGQVARHADPEKLVGLSGITRAYVRKLHALSCLLDKADDRDSWLQSINRPVPVLQAISLPAGTRSLADWSAVTGRDGATVARLNPAFSAGRVAKTGSAPLVLAPAPKAQLAAALQAPGVDAAMDPTPALASTTPLPAPSGPATAAGDRSMLASANAALPASEVAPIDRATTRGPASALPAATADTIDLRPHTHTVSRGESLWTIAKRYKLRVGDLLSRNALAPRAILHPGMVLKLDGELAE
jgi:membrane-bound lytic murein transglycosylase D